MNRNETLYPCYWTWNECDHHNGTFIFIWLAYQVKFDPLDMMNDADDDDDNHDDHLI